MALQQRIVARKLARRIGERVEVLVDGPSPEHELVLQGRLAGQAPDIDPVVFLTDGDPEVLKARRLRHRRDCRHQGLRPGRARARRRCRGVGDRLPTAGLSP